ncbi:bifunctional phosphoglucose/phosphomannose isomerase [Anseongella ginsenosidimutans]|uniref:Bifunctional phosphoglucose/phosphomannose isomerase n=1 Tax=Anseongella ginsenosidimutans TaxID=496056 RepID=A0A4R3KLE2_9SPHI|nr:SIS domain-containing protein [Anseongella ginsenosidimutans]QEC52104.1 hypothetical protein FRZ59_07000 [Anseongella ginsenosidimutans]TCS84868.1 bifunctional phosphoglucose/phosphomannose isomerase [Anseongella ginsenosidimutans]
MKQSSQELKKFSSQIRFALDNYTPHGISKDSLNAVMICGVGDSGIAGNIVKDYFQDKLDLPLSTTSGYLLPRYAGRNTLVIVWSYSGDNEEALAVYDIARERGCRLIVISSGGALSEKARGQEVTLYPAEAGVSSGMALGYALTYLFQAIFELLGVYKKPDLLKIAASLENSNDYLQHSAQLTQHFRESLQYKFIVVCDAFFEGVASRFCQQVNQVARSEAFINVLPEGGYHVLDSYHQKLNSNFIFLNSRLSAPTNLRFSQVKKLLEKQGMEPLELLIADASLNSLFHITHLLDWVALQIAGVAIVSGDVANDNTRPAGTAANITGAAAAGNTAAGTAARAGITAASS